MSNGPVGPVPRLPESIWSTIKNADLDEGGFDLAAGVKYLYAEYGSYQTGVVNWGLYSSAQAPSCAIKAPMQSASWNNLQGGTINTSQNTISSGGTTYVIELCDDGDEIVAQSHEI
jgi:hypothetical protein